MVYLEQKRETEPARILTTLFKDGEGRYHELTVSIPTIEKKDLKDAILIWSILLYATLLLSIILISVWLFYRNMRPLYVLLHWLDSLQTGKPGQPLQNDTKISEFKKLNEAAVRYTDRMEQLFEQQKQFIGNASHEIQTPLAICLGRLEMLMEDESLSESQLEELVKTQHTLEYITKLNKSLLLLTKIDNGQFADTKQLVLNPLVRQYAAKLRRSVQLPVHPRQHGREGDIRTDHERIAGHLPHHQSAEKCLCAQCRRRTHLHHHHFHQHPVPQHRHPASARCSAYIHPLLSRYQESCTTGLGLLAIADSICRMQHLSLCYRYLEGEHCFEIGR